MIPREKKGALGSACMVEVADSKGRCPWKRGRIVGTREDVREQFKRIDVLLDDGTLIEGAHPDCVKEISNE